MRLLWKCAGADRYLLERSTYSDQVKYMCMGGIVLATGIMAAIAGGYAFYTIFEPKGDAMKDYVLHSYGATQGYLEAVHYPTVGMSSIFGLIWGLIIFNIDRFIVSSTGKGDGTEAISWNEFTGALPRIIMGMIIAMTISKPIEIKMFKSEIDVQLHSAQMDKQGENIAKIEELYKTRINAEEKKITEWQAQINTKEDAYTNAESSFQEELNQRPQGSTTGYGPDAKRKEILMNDRKKERDDLRNQLNPFIQSSHDKISSLQKEMQNKIDNSQQNVSGLDGLLERLKIAHQISGFWISLFITLLFMAIELTPIFFKLMLIQGPYDYMSDNIKELIKAENGIEVKYDYYKDKSGQERHLVVYHKPEVEIYEKVKWAESQKEITDKAINKWKQQQLEKVDINLNEFIKEE